jgi:micrococcal nuclease
VTSVQDGDTITLAGGQRVRYLGIDTPELSGDHAFSRAAADRNGRLVGGRTVQLESDADDHDRFGRLLRHVWVDGELAAEVLIREGLGFAQLLPPNRRNRERLEQAQAEARQAGQGLWAGWPASSLFQVQPRATSVPAKSGPPGRCPAEVPEAQAGSGLVGQAAAVCLLRTSANQSEGALRLRSAGRRDGVTVVLFSSTWSAFPAPAQRYFEGKTVLARGRVELFEGEPQLVVRQPGDIRVVQ